MGFQSIVDMSEDRTLRRATGAGHIEGSTDPLNVRGAYNRWSSLAGERSETLEPGRRTECAALLATIEELELLDETSVSVDNELPPQNQDEEELLPERNITALENRMLKIEQGTVSESKLDAFSAKLDGFSTKIGDVGTSMATLTERIQGNQRLFTGAVAVAFLWLCGLTTYLATTIKDVSKLEGRGGSVAVTEAGLANAKTRIEAAADVTLLGAQIQKAVAINKPFSDVELARLGVTVGQAAKSFPEIPAVWNTASQIVNTRFEGNTSGDSKNCLGRTLPELPNTGPEQTFFQIFKNCTLVIDDRESYEADPGYQRFVRGIPTHPNVRTIELRLYHVHVVYRGGILIPVTFIEFTDCTFDFVLPTTPPDSGQKLVRKLLTADLNQPTEFRPTPGV